MNRTGQCWGLCKILEFNSASLRTETSSRQDKPSLLERDRRFGECMLVQSDHSAYLSSPSYSDTNSIRFVPTNLTFFPTNCSEIFLLMSPFRCLRLMSNATNSPEQPSSRNSLKIKTRGKLGENETRRENVISVPKLIVCLKAKTSPIRAHHPDELVLTKSRIERDAAQLSRVDQVPPT